MCPTRLQMSHATKQVHKRPQKDQTTRKHKFPKLDMSSACLANLGASFAARPLTRPLCDSPKDSALLRLDATVRGMVVPVRNPLIVPKNKNTQANAAILKQIRSYVRSTRNSKL